MLGDMRVHPTVPVSDPDRARTFYAEVLGLDLVYEDEAGGIGRARDSFVRLYRSPGAGSSDATVAAWTVDDIEKAVARLRERGVVFEEYDLPHLKTEDAIATFAGHRAAWFRDSEENVLGLVEGPLPGVD